MNFSIMQRLLLNSVSLMYSLFYLVNGLFFFPFGATKSNRSENVLCVQFSLRQNIFLVFNKRIACFIISPSSNNYKAKSLYYQLSLERTYLALTYIKRKILRNSEVLSFLLKEMLRHDRMTV